METVSELRRWLKELQPSAARLLIESNESLRNRARLARSTPGRRAAVAIQSWAARASQRELRAVAASGAVEASRLLAERGWSEESLAKPDEQQLTAMFTELEPPLAELALFGLLIEDFPASTVALRARATLAAAAAAVPGTVTKSEVLVSPGSAPDPVSAQADTDDDLATASLFIADAAEAESQMLDAVNGSPDADLVTAIARHEQANIRLRDLLEELGIHWSARMGLGYATALVEKEASSRQLDRRQSVESEIARLSSQRQVLRDALERDLTPEAAKALETKIAAIDASLAALEPAESLRAAEPPPAPVPDQDTLATVATTDTATDSVPQTPVVDETPRTADEPPPPAATLDQPHDPVLESTSSLADEPGEAAVSPTPRADPDDGAPGVTSALGSVWSSDHDCGVMLRSQSIAPHRCSPAS